MTTPISTEELCEQHTDTFRGDNPALLDSIDALLALDAKGALVPHGIGGHARTLLQSAYVRLRALSSTEGVEEIERALKEITPWPWANGTNWGEIRSDDPEQRFVAQA